MKPVVRRLSLRDRGDGRSRDAAQHLDADNALAHLLGDGREARDFALSVGEAGALNPKLLRLDLRRLIYAGGDEEAQSREEDCARNEEHDEVRAALEEGRHLLLLNRRGNAPS